MNYPRVMSKRHLTTIFKKQPWKLTLNDCIYYVKDQNKQYHFTQYHLTNVRPIKVYILGYDVTRFLTHRSNLTDYSYFFINFVCSTFTLLEVRAYFNGFSKVKRLLPKTNKSAAIPPPSHQQEDVPATDGTSKAWNMLKTMAQGTPSFFKLDLGKYKKFEDRFLLNAALRLSAMNICSIKLPDSRLELYARLRKAGFGKTFHYDLRHFLEATFPSHNLETIVFNYLQDLVLQFGWCRRGTKDMLDGDVSFSLTNKDLVLLGKEDLISSYFTDFDFSDQRQNLSSRF